MEGSPAERDVLLATKLQVPRSRPGLVPRRRLADRLEEGLNRGLVLVAAPAGYGKSVLLSEWVRGMTAPVAWLSLDGGDNDPVRFWRHVLAALDMVRPGIAEGWAVGLQLAALSLRTQPDVVRFVAAFTGSHRYVLDYLTEEVLSRQRQDLRNFLLETSVLERLSGSLCNAVTGRDDSQELLEEVDRSGLFVVQLDDVRGWWRYHHLFADLLRTRLEQDPEHARRLHRNAAGWYERQELPDEAIRHALAAGELQWAARLVEEHFDTVFNLRGEQATIQAWLPALPEDLVRSRPRLLLAQAQMASMRGDLATMEPLLEAAERVIDRADEEPFQPSTGPEGSLLVNARAMLALQRSYAAQLRGDAAATAALTREAMEQLGENELMLSSAVQGFLAMAEWLHGRLAAAGEAFESSIGWWRREGQVTTTAWGFYCLARLHRGQGRLDAAAATCERALEAVGQPGQRPRPAAGPALVGLGEVAYQRDDLDRALEYVHQGITLCRQFVHTPPLAAGLVTLAWIRQAAGDRRGARDAMAEAESVSAGPAGLLNPVPAQRARLLLAQGDVARAARWTGDCGLGPGDAPDYPNEPGHLVLARLLLAQGDAAAADALLDRLDVAAAAQQRAGSLIEIRAIRAMVHAALGDEAAAIAALTSALDLGCPQGYVRVFADEGPAMTAVLGRLISAQRSDQRAARIPLACLARLQRAFGDGHPAGGGAGPDSRTSRLIEQLTSRELEVLAMLAAGRSNQGIASHLVISLDTVKKHVSHLMGKLGAANRTEAVARGRELGLID
jgi:LuxR family transcriptional regulator, maltose regulon positive regulatory protein